MATFVFALYLFEALSGGSDEPLSSNGSSHG